MPPASSKNPLYTEIQQKKSKYELKYFDMAKCNVSSYNEAAAMARWNNIPIPPPSGKGSRAKVCEMIQKWIESQKNPAVIQSAADNLKQHKNRIRADKAHANDSLKKIRDDLAALHKARPKAPTKAENKLFEQTIKQLGKVQLAQSKSLEESELKTVELDVITSRLNARMTVLEDENRLRAREQRRDQKQYKALITEIAKLTADRDRHIVEIGATHASSPGRVHERITHNNAILAQLEQERDGYRREIIAIQRERDQANAKVAETEQRLTRKLEKHSDEIIEVHRQAQHQIRQAELARGKYAGNEDDVRQLYLKLAILEARMDAQKGRSATDDEYKLKIERLESKLASLQATEIDGFQTKIIRIAEDSFDKFVTETERESAASKAELIRLRSLVQQYESEAKANNDRAQQQQPPPSAPAPQASILEQQEAKQRFDTLTLEADRLRRQIQQLNNTILAERIAHNEDRARLEAREADIERASLEQTRTSEELKAMKQKLLEDTALLASSNRERFETIADLTRERDTLVLERKQLEVTVQDLNDDRKLLVQESLQDNKESDEKINALIAGHQIELEKLQAQLEKEEKRGHGTGNDLDAANGKVAELEARITTLTRMKQDYDNALQSSTSQKLQLESDNKTMQTKIDDLTATIDNIGVTQNQELEKIHQQHLSDLQAKDVEYDETRRTLEIKYAEVTSEVALLQYQLRASSSEEIITLTSQLAELLETKRSLEASEQSLRSDVEKRDRQVASVKAQLEAMEQERNRELEQVNVHKAQLLKINDQLQKLTESEARLQQQLKTSDGDVSRTKTELANTQARLTALESAKALEDQAGTKASEREQELKRRLDEAKVVVTQQATAVQKLEAAAGQSAEQITRLTLALDKFQQQEQKRPSVKNLSNEYAVEEVKKHLLELNLSIGQRQPTTDEAQRIHLDESLIHLLSTQGGVSSLPAIMSSLTIEVQRAANVELGKCEAKVADLIKKSEEQHLRVDDLIKKSNEQSFNLHAKDLSHKMALEDCQKRLDESSKSVPRKQPHTSPERTTGRKRPHRPETGIFDVPPTPPREKKRKTAKEDTMEDDTTPTHDELQEVSMLELQRATRRAEERHRDSLKPFVLLPEKPKQSVSEKTFEELKEPAKKTRKPPTKLVVEPKHSRTRAQNRPVSTRTRNSEKKKAASKRQRAA